MHVHQPEGRSARNGRRCRCQFPRIFKPVSLLTNMTTDHGDRTTVENELEAATGLSTPRIPMYITNAKCRNGPQTNAKKLPACIRLKKKRKSPRSAAAVAVNGAKRHPAGEQPKSEIATAAYEELRREAHGGTTVRKRSDEREQKVKRRTIR
ncbi:unnamed protein product [Soboliphyme baturini]|uniref:H15 domain-containing protein n=1 Tax=Soboliphyme baturini TaxID=241478 RepID=A0A183IL09_9BILA|nr:unnamed protein product [Soboliphyme baturini]